MAVLITKPAQRYLGRMYLFLRSTAAAPRILLSVDSRRASLSRGCASLCSKAEDALFWWGLASDSALPHTPAHAHPSTTEWTPLPLECLR